MLETNIEEGNFFSKNLKARDLLVGKMISIDQGEYKGLKGRVLLANEINVMVEIPSKNQKVTLLRTQISEPNKDETTFGVDESGGGGDGWGEAGGNKTPSYHP